MTGAVNSRPNGMLGLRHVALFAADLEACVTFYRDVVGMSVEWQPDADNYYLTSGADNLALHRAKDEIAPRGQRLDHIGFILAQPEQVDIWYDYLGERGVAMKAAPKTHRDGARSFYCMDPAATVVQFIYHPPIANRESEVCHDR